MSGPTLRELEARFFALIRAPEGVAAGLARMGWTAPDLERIIAGDERRSAVGRLDTYANMYFYRILDALAGMFPKLLRVLGEEAFHNLATDYLWACPSSHPSIARVGDRLPGFLRAPDAGRAAAALIRARPWLGDLAALEWARHEVFDAPDARPVTLEALRGLGPEAFAALPLRPVPALRLVAVDWAVEAVWQAVSDGKEAPPAPTPAPRMLLVWRRGLEVLHRPLERLEANELRLLVAGQPGPGALPATFGLLCERLAGGRAEEEAGRAAFGLLAQWAHDGLLDATDPRP